MPQINPMQGASYLPTHTGNINTIRTTSLASPINAVASGIQAAETSFIEHGKAVSNLGKSVESFGKAYQQAVQTRDARIADTEVAATMRERRVNGSMLEGSDADNFLWTEQEWGQNNRTEFLQRHSTLPANIAGPIYDKHFQQHLNWSMNHMLQQNKVADANSRFASALEYNHSMAEAPLTIGSLQAGFAKAAEIYSNDPQLAYKTQQQYLKTFLSSWAERQPISANGQEGVVEWWNRNEEALRPLLGAQYAEGADEMRKTKTWLVDQAYKSEQRAHIRETHAHTAYNRAQAAATTNAFGQIQQALERGDVIDSDYVMSLGLELGLDADHIHKLQNVTDAFLSKSTKLRSNAVMQAYLPSALNGGLSDEEEIEVNNKFLNGDMTPGQFQTLMSTNKSTKNARARGYATEWNIASKYLKDMINPSGGLDSINQPAAVAYWTALGLLQEAIGQTENTSDIKKLLNYNDPESLIYKLATASDLTALERMTKPFDMQTSGVLAEEANKIYVPIFEEWRKSKGYQPGADVKPPIGNFFKSLENLMAGQ